MGSEADRIAKAIVHVFETGTAKPDYGACSILSDGAGISYGASQATDKADSLDTIVFSYIDKGGRLGEKLRPYLDGLDLDDSAKVDPNAPKTWPTWLHDLIRLLKEAGADPVMMTVQDRIFDERYLAPAKRMCEEMGLHTPLALAVVYDTCIQSGVGGVANIRKRFAEAPPSRGGNEVAWVKAYIAARKKWLAAFSNPLVQKTVYRMEAFEKIVAEGNWNLNAPLKVRGVTLT